MLGIARAVDAIVSGIRKGGRLRRSGFERVGGSGTDAGEQSADIRHFASRAGGIAGGKRAITVAVEGAEDSKGTESGLRAKKLTRNDVVGNCASGTTPYVVAAMKFARGRGAMTVAVTSNRRMAAARLAKIVIAPEVGPEVLTGSTRLKAGTSQKMVLNMLSTAVMARLGHVYENLMIDMMLTNEKLAERALRILAEASGKRVSEAEHALRAAGHDMRVALVMLKLRVGAAEARKKLKSGRGELRKAIGE